ncbi:MAG: hypothetical protein R3F30_07780 [Planctomycetota bacterium]
MRRFPILLGPLLTACAAEPEPLPPLPAITSTVSYRLEERAGADAASLALEPGLATRIRADLWLVRAAPPEDGDPLATHTRFVAALRGEEPILPFTTLLSGGRLVHGEGADALLGRVASGDLGTTIRLADDRALVHPGLVTAVVVAPDEAVALAEEGERWRSFELLVTDDVDRSWSVGLWAEDWSGKQEDQPRQELLVLDERLDDEHRVLALTAPVPWFGFERCWFVLGLHLVAEPAVAEAELARCREQLTQEVESRSAGRRPLGADERARRFLARVGEALKIVGQRRHSILELAERANCPLLLDFVLVATDEELAGYVERVLALGDVMKSRVGDELGLALEREAYRYLAQRTASGADRPVLKALLLRHAGELGLQTSILGGLLAEVSSQAELRQGLRDENVLMLHSSNPGTRVRAADWLEAQGLDLGGYDPLGPVEQRREALGAFRERYLRAQGEGAR